MQDPGLARDGSGPAAMAPPRPRRAGRTPVAVVFGAGGGLGAELAAALVDAGWALVAVDVAGAADAAATLLTRRPTGLDGGRPPEIVGLDADPAHLEQIEAVVAAVADRFGTPDAVVNLTRRSEADAAGAGSVMPAFEAVVGLNYWAQVHVAQAFLPGMTGRGRGVLVFNAAVRHGGTGAVVDFSRANDRIVELADALRGRLVDAGVGVDVVVVRHGDGTPRPAAVVANELLAALLDDRPAVWTTEISPPTGG